MRRIEINMGIKDRPLYVNAAYDVELDSQDEERGLDSPTERCIVALRQFADDLEQATSGPPVSGIATRA